jgi:ceramide glucosyltransferase
VIWLAIPALAAAAYYILALVAALRWPSTTRAAGGFSPPVSILKAVRGRDPRFYEAIRSHALQDYPQFEMLFGLSDPCDPAVKDILRLQTEFPDLPISVQHVPTTAPNMKVGVLAELARRARNPVLVINDSDILVEPGYLREVTAPLADPGVGLVTCLYRAAGNALPSRMEALGIATEFAPSVMVARLVGVVEFALGSTMALRSDVLEAIGGLDAIGEYVSDDYQLGRRISSLGRRIEFARVVVETELGAETWREVWRHQVRWSRSIRMSRTLGYYGYGVTHATIWAILAYAAGAWQAAALAMGIRILAGVFVAGKILRYSRAITDLWMIPFRDLFGFAIWVAGLTGSEVFWRGKRLRLLPDGRVRD